MSLWIPFQSHTRVWQNALRELPTSLKPCATFYQRVSQKMDKVPLYDGFVYRNKALHEKPKVLRKMGFEEIKQKTKRKNYAMQFSGKATLTYVIKNMLNYSKRCNTAKDLELAWNTVLRHEQTHLYQAKGHWFDRWMGRLQKKKPAQAKKQSSEDIDLGWHHYQKAVKRRRKWHKRSQASCRKTLQTRFSTATRKTLQQLRYMAMHCLDELQALHHELQYLPWLHPCRRETRGSYNQYAKTMALINSQLHKLEKPMSKR